MGRGWLMETARPFSEYEVSGQLQSLTMYDPVGSGYGDDMGVGAPEALAADLDKLWGGIPSSLWVSRMYAQLPRTALAQDLTIGAAPSQATIAGNLVAKKGINLPECPTYPPCEDGGATGGAGGAGGGGAGGGGTTGGCAVVRGDDPSAALGALALGLGLAFARRRRGRKQA
jgi:MYXO-CTERM domain-containing protein